MKYVRTAGFLIDLRRLPAEHRKLFVVAVHFCGRPWTRGRIPVPCLATSLAHSPDRRSYSMTWSFASPDSRALFRLAEVNGETVVVIPHRKPLGLRLVNDHATAPVPSLGEYGLWVPCSPFRGESARAGCVREPPVCTGRGTLPVYARQRTEQGTLDRWPGGDASSPGISFVSRWLPAGTIARTISCTSQVADSKEASR